MSRLTDLLIGALVVASFVAAGMAEWQAAQYMVLLAVGLELSQHRSGGETLEGP